MSAPNALSTSRTELQNLGVAGFYQIGLIRAAQEILSDPLLSAKIPHTALAGADQAAR